MLSAIKKAGSLLVLALVLFAAVMSIENISLDDIKLVMNWEPVHNAEDIKVSITGPTNKIGINNTVVLTAKVEDGKNESEVEWSYIRIPGWWDLSFGKDIVKIDPLKGKETNLTLTQKGMGVVYVKATLSTVGTDGKKIRIQAKPYRLYIVPNEDL